LGGLDLWRLEGLRGLFLSWKFIGRKFLKLASLMFNLEERISKRSRKERGRNLPKRELRKKFWSLFFPLVGNGFLGLTGILGEKELEGTGEKRLIPD